MAHLGGSMAPGYARQLASSLAPELRKLPPRAVVQTAWAFGCCGQAPAAMLDVLRSLIGRYASDEAWEAMKPRERSDAVAVLTGTPWALASEDWPQVRFPPPYIRCGPWLRCKSLLCCGNCYDGLQ
jgi:hypothetical protein